MSFKILTDSCCDLPKEIIEKYDIEVLPIIVIKDDKEYLDGINITPEEVYSGMRDGKVFSTAQIPAISFQEKFEQYAKNGDSVIYIAFSSGLSGTYQTSLVVKDTILEEYPEFDLTIIDTKAASLGFGLIVYEAAKLRAEGKTKEEVLNAIDFFIKNIEHIVTVDDIEYLYRGGRVSRATAFVGGLLNIKPIIEMLDGKLVPLDKVRGKNNVYKRMLEIVTERGKKADLSKQTIGIGHGDDIKGAMKLKEMLEERLGAKEFIINTIGSAIGAHSGPGTLTIFFFKDNYK